MGGKGSGGAREFSRPTGDEWRALNLPRPAKASDYGEWIARAWPWQLFVTLTVRDPEASGAFTAVGVGGVERALEKWWGESVRQRSHTARGLFAMERHQFRSTPHLHGLIGGLSGDLVDDVVIGRRFRDGDHSYLWREWFRERVGGLSRIEPVTDLAGVTGYVAKYLMKDLGKLYALDLKPAAGAACDPTPA